MNELAVWKMDEIERAASAMSKSGFFQDAREQAQAVVKILAGQELGFGPFASMTGVYIIQGRPALGANLMAAAIKKSGRYDYRVVQLDDAACEIAFFEKGQEIGRSRFTLDDAKKAGTKNLDKFPRNMLFARAISNGVRWYTPDIFGGSPPYTPEELGAETNEDGQVITVMASPAPTPPPAPQPEKPWASILISLETAKSEKSSEGHLYWEMPTADLAIRANSIDKKLHDNHLEPAAREERQRKLDIIRAILEYRNS